jgi:hypothetical protein
MVIIIPRTIWILNCLAVLAVGCGLWLASDGSVEAITRQQLIAISGTPRLTPATISGSTLVGWWDASQSGTITIATGVSNWSSRSPAVLKLTQATGTCQPAYAANGVTFTTTQVMTVASWPTVWDMLVVTTKGANHSFNALLSGAAAEEFLTQVTLLGGWTGTLSQFDSLTWAATTPGIGYETLPASNKPSASVNGGTVSSALASALTNPVPTVVGNSPGCNGTESWGTINELHVFSAALTTLQRQQDEGYLACKPSWSSLGLQALLPSNHPYKSAASCAVFAYP